MSNQNEMTPEQREWLQRLHQQRRRLHRELRVLDELVDEERDEHQRALAGAEALIVRAGAMLGALAGAEARGAIRRIRGEGEP